MGGLLGLLDDVAALVRLAAASVDDVAAAAGRATGKTAAVLIDDAAVTPQYVHGLAANRELPIIARIAKGSLRNKFLFVLPALLLLSELLPGLLTPILMVGGTYLAYEGAHKIHAALTGHGGAGHEAETVARDEESVVAGAIRTDLILSAEIMTIALDEVAAEGLLMRAAVLVVVAILITALVYGVVALIVRMDDVGLRLVEQGGQRADLGRRIVLMMPRVLSGLATVGTAAMLWVGGHIILVGARDLGLTAPYDALTSLEHTVADATGPVGDLLAWVTDTTASALLGLVVGTVVVYALMVVARLRDDPEHADAGQPDQH